MQTKTKRVFQLRKTSSKLKQNNQQSHALDQEEVSPGPAQVQKIQTKDQSILPQDSLRYEPTYTQRQQQQSLASHPQLSIDQNQLHFYEKIGNVQVKNLVVKNFGSSAIYFEWNFKNLPKINSNAIKDPKPNFYCHYQPNVIKPGEQQIFSFSFFSETPGVFVQEIQLVCQPEPATPIPPFRLKGVAYIQDSLKSKRDKLGSQIDERSTQVFTKQVLNDILNQVKSPVPPLPDVSNPQIAQKQFELANSNHKLYYNSQVHSWFNSLYIDICNQLQIHEEKRYWDQSVATLANMIDKVKDPIYQEHFQKRLQNYKSLSTTRPPQKSDLFPKVKETLMQVGYALGGAIADQSKKQLEMWEIPFQQPSQTQTEQQATAKKDQRTKIIAEWAKKMKKKKWGPDQQKQMLNNYQSKLQKGVSKALMQKLTGFDDQASFQSCKAKIKQQFSVDKYFGFLQRFKTVEQFPIQGKKIFLKFDLKLKQNSKQALQKLEQYLQKKKEQQLRAEEQRKNQEASKAKKKAAPVKKKKGQKQEQEQKVLTFDFNTLLDQQSWQGFVSTLRFIIQKQPLLLIIGISFGPKSGVYIQKSSLKYLLQPLKAIQPSIQFLQHKDLLTLKQKIAQQTLSQGSLYLTQNISFLPCQCMQKGTVKPSQTGQPTIQSSKMLMPQITKQLQQLMPAFDIIIREDRFVNRVSGICSYGKKMSVLGLAWWKFIAFGLRARGALAVVGGQFGAEKLGQIYRMAKYCKRIYVVGELGVKIWMAEHSIEHFYNLKLTKNQLSFVKYVTDQLKADSNFQKIMLPKDIILQSQNQQQKHTQIFSLSSKPQQNTPKKVIDIGPQACNQITKIQNGHLFIIDSPSLEKHSHKSLQILSKNLYTKKEQKKLRHQNQQSTPAGINYEKDLVVYLIGIQEADVEKIQLKEKKVKQKEAEEEEPEEEEPEQEEEVKKIEKICDFRVSDVGFINGILAGEFSYGLKDVSRYPKSD